MFTWAPKSCNSLQEPGKTSVAMTGYPFLSRFLAMGLPIFPRPTKPTGVLEAIDRDDTEGKHSSERRRKTNSAKMKYIAISLEQKLFQCSNRDSRATVRLNARWFSSCLAKLLNAVGPGYQGATSRMPPIQDTVRGLDPDSRVKTRSSTSNPHVILFFLQFSLVELSSYFISVMTKNLHGFIQ